MTTHTDTERLKAMEAAATKGPWECDTTHNEGSYGAGEDVYEGFKSYTILSEDGKVLFDSLNSDAIEVHEEYDEDGATAWDEIARRNAELIVAMRNALPSLLARIEALTVEPEFPMSDAIQQERDRLARILEAEALKRSPLTDNGVTQRVTYAIAARIVRRGRALTDREKLENLMRGLEDIEDDEVPTK